MARDRFLDALRFDKRLIQRNIERGKFTREDYEKYLHSLKDVSSKAEPLFTDQEEGKPEGTRKAG